MINHPCPSPCAAFVEGVVDPSDDYTQCAMCGMWFVMAPDPDDKEGEG